MTPISLQTLTRPFGLVMVLMVLWGAPKGFAKGNEKYQIKLVVSPSVEWIHFRNDLTGLNDLFGPKLSYNFGFEYLHFLSPGFSLSTGLQYQNKGFRNETEYLIAGSNETDQGITIGSARYATMPFDMNFHIRIAKKTHILISTGLLGGYLVNSTVNNSNYTNEDTPDNGSLFTLSNGKSNIDLFSDWYFGYQAGLGFSKAIKSRMIIVVQPMYRYQFSRAIPLDANITQVVSAKLNSFAIDFKVGYYFSRQIRNQQKDF